MDDKYGPNGDPSTRATSPYPTQHAVPNIASAIKENASRYQLAKDADAVSMGITSFPKYLKLCSQRLDMRIQAETIEAKIVDAGFHAIIRCAMMSGLNQLSLDSHVKAYIEIKRESYLSNASGMMLNEASRVLDDWRISPPSPSGVLKRFSFRVRPDTHARLVKLSEDLGLSISQLSITAVVFGLFDQPEIASSSNDLTSHAHTIAEHVHGFDGLIRIRLEIAKAIVRLMGGRSVVSLKPKQPITSNV